MNTWDTVNQKNGWIESIKREGKFVIKKNTKKVQVWLLPEDVKTPDDLNRLTHYACFEAATLLWRLGVVVDISKVAVNTKHISIEQSELDRMIPKGTNVTVKLNRTIEKIFENDKEEEAYAKIDDSPFKCIETNDVKYARDVLLMPEYIKATNRAMEGLVEHWNIHLPLMQKTDKGIDELRIGISQLVEVVKELRDVIKELNK